MEPLQRLPVDSSDIVSVGYDAKSGVLEVEFSGNRVYRYRNVEPDIYHHFMRADSYGQYFFANINGRYRYERVDTKARGQEPPKTLAFIAGNTSEAQDLQRACEPYGIVVEQLEIPVDEVQSHDAEYIALKKAKSAHALTGRPVAVSTTFWNILALHGFPGAFMHYVTGWLRAEDFLRLMDDKQERTILRTDTLVYYDGKRSKTFARNLSGTLTTEPRGTGSAIDQIVVLTGQTETIAEMQQTNLPQKDLEGTVWHDFAKWLHLQRRLGKA